MLRFCTGGNRLLMRRCTGFSSQKASVSVGINPRRAEAKTPPPPIPSTPPKFEYKSAAAYPGSGSTMFGFGTRFQAIMSVGFVLSVMVVTVGCYWMAKEMGMVTQQRESQTRRKAMRTETTLTNPETGRAPQP